MTEGEIRLLREIESLRAQLNVFAKLFSKDRTSAQELRRSRERLAKVTAERNLLRRMLSVKVAAADPVDYDTLTQHSHRKTPK